MSKNNNESKAKRRERKEKIVLIIKLFKDTDLNRKSRIEYFKCQIDQLYLLVFKVVSKFPCVIQNNHSLCVCVCVCYFVLIKFTYVTHVTHDVVEPTAFVSLWVSRLPHLCLFTLGLVSHTRPFPVLGRPSVQLIFLHCPELAPLNLLSISHPFYRKYSLATTNRALA